MAIKKRLTYFQETVAGTHGDRDGSVATGTTGSCHAECSGGSGAACADVAHRHPVEILGQPGRGQGRPPPGTEPLVGVDGCGPPGPFLGRLGRARAFRAVSGGYLAVVGDLWGMVGRDRQGSQELRWGLWLAAVGIEEKDFVTSDGPVLRHLGLVGFEVVEDSDWCPVGLGLGFVETPGIDWIGSGRSEVRNFVVTVAGEYCNHWGSSWAEVAGLAGGPPDWWRGC